MVMIIYQFLAHNFQYTKTILIIKLDIQNKTALWNILVISFFEVKLNFLPNLHVFIHSS